MQVCWPKFPAYITKHNTHGTWLDHMIKKLSNARNIFVLIAGGQAASQPQAQAQAQTQATAQPQTAEAKKKKKKVSSTADKTKSDTRKISVRKQLKERHSAKVKNRKTRGTCYGITACSNSFSGVEVKKGLPNLKE